MRSIKPQRKVKTMTNSNKPLQNFTIVMRDGTKKLVEATEHMLKEVGNFGVRAVVIHARVSVGACSYVLAPDGQPHHNI